MPEFASDLPNQISFVRLECIDETNRISSLDAGKHGAKRSYPFVQQLLCNIPCDEKGTEVCRPASYRSAPRRLMRLLDQLQIGAHAEISRSLSDRRRALKLLPNRSLYCQGNQVGGDGGQGARNLLTLVNVISNSNRALKQDPPCPAVAIPVHPPSPWCLCLKIQSICQSPARPPLTPGVGRHHDTRTRRRDDQTMCLLG